MKLTHFERAKKKLREAEQAFVDASIAEFPVGYTVEWIHGKYVRRAIVTSHVERYPRVSLENMDGKRIRPRDTIGLKRVTE